ncbi:MAG: hypothetical protein ACUVSY_17780 [Roseiflexus sp.]
MNDTQCQIPGERRTSKLRTPLVNWLLGETLSFDWNIVAISVISVSLLVFDRYHSITPYK